LLVLTSPETADESRDGFAKTLDQKTNGKSFAIVLHARQNPDGRFRDFAISADLKEIASLGGDPATAMLYRQIGQPQPAGIGAKYDGIVELFEPRETGDSRYAGLAAAAADSADPVFKTVAAQALKEAATQHPQEVFAALLASK